MHFVEDATVVSRHNPHVKVTLRVCFQEKHVFGIRHHERRRHDSHFRDSDVDVGQDTRGVEARATSCREEPVSPDQV